MFRYRLSALILVGVMQTPPVSGQSAPHFEVATIKPSKDCLPGARSGGNQAPGRLTLKCAPLTGLITNAYLRFQDGRFVSQNRPVPITGAPAWAESELYDVNAKAEGAATEAMMQGPMMQALLEDRFKLKLHRDTRSVPVYSLVQSGRGLKIHPFVESSCIPVDRSTFPPPPATPNSCHSRGRREGNIWVIDAQAMTVAEFAKVYLNGDLDRPVIDNTGITGMYDFHMEYAIDQSTPRYTPVDTTAGDRAGPSIFTAVQEQLGLKLESTKGPGQALVIDHVERPSEN